MYYDLRVSESVFQQMLWTRRMQLDPVYPYLNGMTGLNDPGDDMALGGNVGPDKVR